MRGSNVSYFITIKWEVATSLGVARLSDLSILIFQLNTLRTGDADLRF